MNVESITVALRPRTAWEAVELGTALTRRHAGAIWRPWLVQSVGVLAVLHLLGWALQAMWLVPLLMWWLKPVFDRIPLYVLSRAVFGSVPGTGETLRAQWHWGLRWMPAYLTWRRLSPVRALNLPVDLLEGGNAASARQRRRALVGPAYGVATLTTLLCLHFELALYLGFNFLAVLFIPAEQLAETAHTLWEAMLQPPTWLDVVQNLLTWLAITLVSPFYVGAGFGLYLNRRTEIEGWDIEVALRRLAARLARTGAAVVLVLACLAPLQWAHAQDAPGPARAPAPVETRDADDDAGAKEAPPTLPPVFGTLADDAALREGVERAMADPSVTPKRTVQRWKRIDREEEDEAELDTGPLQRFSRAMGKALGLLGEIGLWVVLAAVALLLTLTARHWWPWLQGVTRRERRPDAEAVQAALPEHAPLPDDVPGAVRALWQDGRRRDALALLYRASVESMAARARVDLVPGATEATCLRAARRLPDAADRDAFETVVRTWQYAAYADRWPDTPHVEAMLDRIAARFGWGHRAPPPVEASA